MAASHLKDLQTCHKFIFGCSLLLMIGASTAATSPKTVEYHLVEEQSPNILLGNIIVDAKLNMEYSAAEIAEFHFRFLTTAIGTATYRQLFTLQNGTGILLTSKVIDRDSICTRQQAECTVELDVAVQPVNYFQIIRVIIHIEDLNDNAPSFPQDEITVNIAENSAIGSTFVLPSANDPDAVHYGIQHYQLLSDTPKFELRVLNDSDMADPKPRLVLRQRLDHEAVNSYSLKIVAWDGGNPQKFGSMKINVVILDANDNAPKFRNSSYVVNVDENHPLDSVIIQVTADDADEGKNGDIMYRFTSETANLHGSLFSIKESTGDIYITKLLDYEEANKYHLSVMAEDKGPNSQTADTKITVNVFDINDNAPQITVDSLTSTGHAQILENAAVGTFVAHVSIVDRDSGHNGEFSCSLDNPFFDLQHLYQTEYKIVSTRLFDREEGSEYHLNLMCSDNGQPSLISAKRITVNIMDINDHTPEFVQRVYSVSIKENVSFTGHLCEVNAKDADVTENGLVTYTLRSLDDTIPPVVINPTTGVITTNHIFDYERQQSFEFVIIASDNGNPPRSSTAMLSLIIIDINDEQPTFIQSTYSFGTFENQPVKADVGTVMAYDLDSPPYNIVIYTFDWHGGDIGSFAIDEESGRITLKKMLDRETQDTYQVVVIATNKDSDKSSSANVTIYVADQNDNAPTIDFPTHANKTVEIPRDAGKGYIVTEIKAHDLDVGINSVLQYAIMDGSGKELFDIPDPSKGTVMVKKDLSNQGNQVFRLTILVRDEGIPMLTDTTELRIFVNDSIVASLPSTGGTVGVGVLVVVIVVAMVIFLILFVTLLVLLWRRRILSHQSKALKYEYHIEVSKAANGGGGCLERGSDIMQMSPQWVTDVTIAERGKESSTQRGQCWPLAVNLDELTQSPASRNARFSNTYSISPAVSETKIVNTVPPVSQRQRCMQYLEDPRRKLLYTASPQLASDNLKPLRTISLTSEEQSFDSDQGSLTDSGRGPSEEGELLGLWNPPISVAPVNHRGRQAVVSQRQTDRTSNVFPGLRHDYHHKSAPVIYNALAQHGRASGDCGAEMQQHYPECSCASTDTVKKCLPSSPLREQIKDNYRKNAKERKSTSMDRRDRCTNSYDSAMSHRHDRNNGYDVDHEGRFAHGACHPGNVTNCVRDVVARYIPEAARKQCCVQLPGEQEASGGDDISLHGERASVDGDSDDSTTTSGSYVLDAGDQLKEQRSAFDDVFV